MAVFSTAEAERAGVDRHRLRSGVQAGELVCLRRGWYARSGRRRPDAEYLARCTAAARSHEMPLSHVSALVAHGLPGYDLDDRPVYLVGAGTEHRVRAGVHVTMALPGGPHLHADSTKVSLPEALLTAALVDPELALAAADSAARDGRTTRDELVAQAGRLRGRRGAGAARTALGLVDPRRESVGESRAAWLCHLWGYELEPQVAVDLGGRRVYPDFRIRGTRVLIEFDGLAKYVDQAALAREKQREDELRRRGWVVVRITWADLYRPDAVRARIESALTLSARA